MNENFETRLFTLRKLLQEFVLQFGFCGLKGGTETEDMDHDELKFLHLLGKDIVPVGVKIGGPEARTDIRACIEIGIDGISAPMIESEYALRNFISTLKSLTPPSVYNKIRKSINLETITGYRNLLEIADSPAFLEIQSVTAARSDLSASMNLKPDDAEVMRVTKQIVKICKERGKRTSVGGTITNKNFFTICEEIEPDQINSRHIAVDLKIIKENNLNDVPSAMLNFEIELYNWLAYLKPQRSIYYQNRIEINKERIGLKRTVYSIR